MRDLARYPITNEEIVRTLTEAMESLPKELVGDIRPMAIRLAIERLCGRTVLCVFEARSRDGNQSLTAPVEPWCTKHGWDCPNMGEGQQRIGKIIPYGGITRLNLPPERLLEGAKAADLEGVVVIGYTKDQREYAASSYADGGTVLWLLERTKLRLLAVVDSENFT